MGAGALPRLNRLAVPEGDIDAAEPDGEEPAAAEPVAPAGERAAPPAATASKKRGMQREIPDVPGIQTVPALGGDPVADDLAVLDANEVMGCRKCPLAKSRTNTVFGEGNPHADLVFVGEAPGADEDEHGRPFVGRAGKLLEDIINKGMGLQRSDVFICNVLKCRPPGNRTPQPDEVAECSPYLLRQLTLIEPKVIVALGAAAAQCLLQTTEAVGRLRGAVHDYVVDPMRDPIPLIVTYHPAYLLRNYTKDARAKVWSDIQKAMTIAGIPIPKKK